MLSNTIHSRDASSWGARHECIDDDAIALARSSPDPDRVERVRNQRAADPADRAGDQVFQGAGKAGDGDEGARRCLFRISPPSKAGAAGTSALSLGSLRTNHARAQQQREASNVSGWCVGAQAR